MKKTIVCLVASIGISGLASADPYFHTDFDEASLGDITGLNIDAPFPDGPDGGTVTLDTDNQKLIMTADAANLWANREGAPIAWVASPTVAVGDTWFVETQITHTDSTDDNSTFDQAGITFYSGEADANPGSENDGENQSLMVGINDWNAWAHRVQGFADNNPNVSEPASEDDDTFEYRVEITENGDYDIYNFFYREDPADDWTQFGDEDLEQDFDNTAVGLFIKSHNNNFSAETEFGYLTVDTIGGLTGADTDEDGIDDGWELAKTAAPGNLTDLTGLKAGPGPGADTGDFDNDGLTDLEEFNLAVTDATYPGISPILADTDDDGRNDGDEVNGVVGPPAIPATDPTNSDSDGDGLLDGAEDNSGTFIDAAKTGTDPNNPNSDGDAFDDGREVELGSDPNDANSVPDIVEGYMATGGDWLSAHGEFDIDGDGALGTDGYIFFGDFEGIQMNGQDYTFRVESDSLPSYLVSHDMGVDFLSAAAAFPSYGMIDNPLTLDGTDQFGGIAVGNAGEAGTSLELVTFDVAALPGTVRVGILGGIEGNPDGRWDPSEITLAGPNGYLETATELEADPGGVNAGWLFFDITDGGTYTVSATRRAGLGGAGIGGLTFDSTAGDLQIQSIDYDKGTEMVTLTWNSSPGATYSLYYGTDLITFDSEIDDSVESEGDATSLTFANPAVGALELFFRVERN